jgi:hypothetical protein
MASPFAVSAATRFSHLPWPDGRRISTQWPKYFDRNIPKQPDSSAGAPRMFVSRNRLHFYITERLQKT